jgi:hypothetical protein
MIPYIYSMNYRTFKDGRALCEPLYYTYPENKESFEYGNEYFFGSELLVCPVTSKLDSKTKMASTKMWLPEGRWTNIFDGKIYKGVSNIGVCPTFEERKVHLETHLVDFSGDLYGKEMKIYLIDFIRDEMIFESADRLMEQIYIDKNRVIKEIGEITWQELGLK